MHALINMDPPSTTSDGGIIEQSLLKSSQGAQVGLTDHSSTAQFSGQSEKREPPKLDDKTPAESEMMSEKSSTTKTCSVKLVDIKTTGESLKRDQPPGQVSESDEPNAKKCRPSLPVDTTSAAHRVLLKPKDFVDLKRRTVSGFKPTSSDEKTHTEDTKPIDTSTFDNVEEELGRLFGGSNSPTKKDNKVTISPVKSACLTKDIRKQCVNANSAAPTSSPSLPASSSGGSVTITKLSTGSSLSVESKDLKTVLSGGGGSRQQSAVQPNQSQAKSENGVRLKGNIDITALGASSNSKQQPSSQASSSEAGSIRCNKCGIEYSTKEARRLHTCNSILDQHYLSVENAGERSNSKSSSPNSPTVPASETVTSGTTATSSSSPSSFDSASSRSNSPMMDQWNNSRKLSSSNSSTASSTASSNSNLKLIKEKSEKLIIEGRPKLSVTKVSKTEMDKTSPPLPKFKLSTDADKNKSRWTTAAGGETNLAAYSGKLKIKVGGAPPTGSEKQNSDTGPEGGLAFSFAGKPTYSPSRIEPSNTNSGAVQTKGKDHHSLGYTKLTCILPPESPRDASNKDSPASQADSGVYSIASSSSPSKGDAAPTTESTSPDSPNRDRMAFPEQNFGRDIQCESILLF